MLFGGFQSRESDINTEQVDSAALVYFLRAEFRGARVAQKSRMFAHSALPLFLQGYDLSHFHKLSLLLMPPGLKCPKSLAVPILLPVLASP
jgi:hypothetical protein